MTKRSPIEVRLRIDFAPRGSIGPGKIALLEAIEATGSLSQAARDLSMSYRRAWGLLDDLNHTLAEPVARASAGGTGGGGAQLTAFGRRLIAAYRAVERVSQRAADAQLARARPKSPRATALRRPMTKSGRHARSRR
jgi:molybdate transport system regulatory protein